MRLTARGTTGALSLTSMRHPRGAVSVSACNVQRSYLVGCRTARASTNTVLVEYSYDMAQIAGSAQLLRRHSRGRVEVFSADARNSSRNRLEGVTAQTLSIVER